MKTGEVQDPGDGTAAYLETDGWTPWLYHAYEEELDRYRSAANALMMKLERMPPAVRGRLERIEIRCPVKGCLLATVYWIPRKPTAEEIEYHQRLCDIAPPGATGPQMHSLFRRARDALYMGRTAAGTEVYDILTYGFPFTWKDEARGCSCCRIVYWRAGCRHGTATLERHAMLELFSVVHRVHGLRETEEEAFARLPEHLRPFWGKRVFHPEPSTWHPKKQRRARSRQDPGPAGSR
jgi:hypothetical protein